MRVTTTIDFNLPGNKETLEVIPKSQGLDTRDELLAFHSKYYSSNIMGCCVVGKEDLDTLQKMVVPLMETVLDKKVGIPSWKEHPYTEKELKVGFIKKFLKKWTY